VREGDDDPADPVGTTRTTGTSSMNPKPRTVENVHVAPSSTECHTLTMLLPTVVPTSSNDPSGSAASATPKAEVPTPAPEVHVTPPSVECDTLTVWTPPAMLRLDPTVAGNHGAVTRCWLMEHALLGTSAYVRHQ
jgi:hypothetical protein